MSNEATQVPFAKTKDRRRYLRFSLRTFLFATLLLGIVIGPWLYRAKRQEEAVKAIQEIGGKFGYRYQQIGGSVYSHQVAPIWPAWLRDLLGEHCFITPTGLTIVPPNERKIGGSTLDLLNSLPTLESLYFGKVQLSQTNCQEIGSLKKLTSLFLGNAFSADDKLLDFSFIEPLSELELLQITDSKFGNNDAMFLSDKKHLQNLFLYRNEITDDGMKYFSNLENLERLGLSGNKISDEGLGRLRNLPSLKYLSLNDTGITDRSIPQIANFESLEELEIIRTKLTETGILDLRKRLPNCKINK